MPQTPVTDTIKINTTLAGAQFAPAVCALSGGGYITVWQDSSAGAIYAQRFNASGQPVGNELHLDSTQGGSALWVSVAATANDGFVIAFQAGFDTQAEIFARRYDGANNAVGGLFAANTTSPNEQFNPHVTALDNGSLLFTWDTRFSSGNDVVNQEVRGRIYDASGQALGNDFAIAPMSATDRHGLSAVAPLSGGDFVVTWQRAANSGTNFEIVGQRFTATGVPTGTQFQVNTQIANNQYGNDVARLSDGGFVVSWVDPGSGNGGGRIVARHFDASFNAIGGEIAVDTKATGAYGRTVVTALADGGYVVGWAEEDGADNNFLARAFGPNDQPQGAAFEMSFNSPFSGNFFSDGAVTLPNGNVVFAWDGPSVTPPGGQATGQDVYMRVYNFSGSAPPIPGTSGPDTLLGTQGDDVIQGLGGNDLLVGGPGNDRMEGGTGDDAYVVDDSGDEVVEEAGAGNDVVFVSASYTLGAGQEIETLSTQTHAGTSPIDLVGNQLNNTLYGNNGNNLLNGGAGADTMVGLGGDDTYVIDNAGDLVVDLPGGGNDVVMTWLSHTLSNGNEIETLSAASHLGTDPIALGGNDYANHLIGNHGDNYLNGGGGADLMTGLLGNDTFVVDNAGDQVEEAVGGGGDALLSFVSYTLAAGQEVEVLSTAWHAGTGAIDLGGNEFAQTLFGNGGANLLDGGSGSDTLIGFGGADTFRFSTALGAGNVDAIGDFSAGIDRIALDDAVFTAAGGPGALNAAAFATGTAAGDGDDRIIYNSATGALFYDADGNGAGAAVQFATLGTGLALAASDFILV